MAALVRELLIWVVNVNRKHWPSFMKLVAKIVFCDPPICAW